MQPGFFSLSFRIHSAPFMVLFGILLMLLDVCTGGGEVRFQKRGRWGSEGPPLAIGHAPLPRENTINTSPRPELSAVRQWDPERGLRA